MPEDIGSSLPSTVALSNSCVKLSNQICTEKSNAAVASVK